KQACEVWSRRQMLRCTSRKQLKIGCKYLNGKRRDRHPIARGRCTGIDQSNARCVRCVEECPEMRRFFDFGDGYSGALNRT
ncbi:hypothetical protein M3583_25665, partial [Bacillus subtilis]|nr:hypothetical protein [Bacillus subtilis]